MTIPDKHVTVCVLRVKLKSDPIKREGPKVSLDLTGAGHMITLCYY